MRVPRVRASVQSLAFAITCGTSLAAQCEVAEIFPATGSTFDGFGIALAAEGDRVLVGARRDDTFGLDAGSVVELTRTNGVWIETDEFSASDTVTRDRFGSAIAIDSGRAVIGATRARSNGVETGAAYVFELVGGSWTETARLTASDGQDGDRFGFAVAVSGDRVLVGAPQSDQLANRAGSAYVFEFSGSWVETAILFSSSPVQDDRFGRAVDIEGDRILVGAPTILGSPVTGPPSAFAFEHDGLAWNETQVFEPPGAFAFGETVQLDGDRALLMDHQLAHLYDRQGALWVLDEVIDPNVDSAFVGGNTAIVSGDRLIFGRGFADRQQTFRAKGAGWISTGWLETTGATDEGLGTSMVIVGDELLAGGPGPNSQLIAQPGVVRVFDLSLPTFYCTAKTNSLGCQPMLYASGEPSASLLSNFFTLTATNVLNQKNGLLFHGIGRANLPFLGGILCVQPPLQRTPIQFSSGSSPPTQDCSGSYGFALVDWLEQQNPGGNVGTTVNAQYWSRDPNASFGVGLTEAFEVFICP